MSGDDTWTLKRVRDERPELAELAQLHLMLDGALARVGERIGHEALHPKYVGAPAMHWFQGTPLLRACPAQSLVDPVREMLGAMSEALSLAHPKLASAFTELRAAWRKPDFPWEDRLLRYLEPVPGDVVPHPGLFRFLLYRALSVPATHLVHSVSPPHSDRWKVAACPFCGIPVAAQVAAPGSQRRHVCVLCGGRWMTADLSCGSCGESNRGNDRVLASVEAGPASIEVCGTCGAAVKVFSDAHLEPHSPLACEVRTVGLDIVAGREGGAHRHETALAALFPPG